MKDIISKKWHLHTGLSIVGAIWFLKFTDTYPNFLDIGSSGNFLQIFLTSFFCFIFAYFVEVVQTVKFGANKTDAEVWQSKLDIVAGVVGSIIGTIIYFIFMKVSIIISITFLILALYIEYKRRNNIKK